MRVINATKTDKQLIKQRRRNQGRRQKMLGVDRAI